MSDPKPAGPNASQKTSTDIKITVTYNRELSTEEWQFMDRITHELVEEMMGRFTPPVSVELAVGRPWTSRPW